MTDISEMYEHAGELCRQMGKKSYAANMGSFRQRYDRELHALLDTAEEVGPEAAARQFVESVARRFAKKGKIPRRLQPDLNGFTVCYVLPALDLSEHPRRGALIDAICAAWGARFRNSAISFGSYETILNSFQRTFLGIRF